MECRPGPLEGVVMPSPSFWKGRPVLITGHTGFKGAWLWQWLELLGAEPAGFALPPHTDPSLFHLAGLDDRSRSRFGDIRDRLSFAAAMRDAEPEIVFHLAAQSLVQRSYREPIETLETNILGTARVLEASVAAPSVRGVVIVSSDKCYLPRPTACREEDPLGGADPYSASKACAEIVTECWRRSFPTNPSKGIASVRAGNVLGGGDWAAGRLIPDCVRAFRNGQPVELRYPDAVRPFQHVLDALAGYLMLAERLYDDPSGFGQSWNFGPDPSSARSVRSVVSQFADRWGDGARYGVAAAGNSPEEPLLLLDAAKAGARLGWRPRLNLDDTLAWTEEWYRRQADGESARDLCAEQIRRFPDSGRDGQP